MEHSTLISRLVDCEVPKYIISWVQEFLFERQFFCCHEGITSASYKQTRGVPQGSVLSPLLFNILLSSIPVHKNVPLYVYADDIAFFSSSRDINSLYQILQSYLSELEVWLGGLSFSLNVSKCALLVFPLSVPVFLSLHYRNDPIPQVTALKYLGIVYVDNLNWQQQIESNTRKAESAVGLLRRFCNKNSGMRRDTLLMIYKLYVRPILEFGCVLFSGSAEYKLRPLILLERQALRLCLGLPRCVANSVLYLEARIIPLDARFRQLTVQTFLKLYDAPLFCSQTVFIKHPVSFFQRPWFRYQRPQVIFVESLLSNLHVSLRHLTPHTQFSVPVDLIFDDIFPKNAKLLPKHVLEGLLQDHLSHFPKYVVISTDATQNLQKAGVGIFSHQLNWSFALRLPDFTPIYLAEFLAITLALRKLNYQQSKAIIISDALSVCTHLTSAKKSPLLRIFWSLVPHSLSEVRFIWVPGHAGIELNEIADSLASASLNFPVVLVAPQFPFITAERFKRLLILKINETSLLQSEEFRHLQFTWNTAKCLSRQCEVTLTSFRCRVPLLNFYLNKSGFSLTNLCVVCNEPETIDHFLLTCRRFASLRRIILERPIGMLGLPVNTSTLLSFGASQLGVGRSAILSALHKFIQATGRIRC